jgi:hypothetical protein
LISQITLRNFQCWGEKPQTFELKPLTLIFGPNGAGKSTVQRALRFVHWAVNESGGESFPFDVPGADFWSPGNLINRNGAVTSSISDFENATQRFMEIELETEIDPISEDDFNQLAKTKPTWVPSFESFFPFTKMRTMWRINGFGNVISLRLSFESDAVTELAFYESASIEFCKVLEEGQLKWSLSKPDEIGEFISAVQAHLFEIEGTIPLWNFSDFSAHELGLQFTFEEVQEVKADVEGALSFANVAYPIFGYKEFSKSQWVTERGVKGMALLNMYFAFHYEKLVNAIKVVEHIPPIREIPQTISAIDSSHQVDRIEVTRALESITGGRFGYFESAPEVEGFGKESKWLLKGVVDNFANGARVRFSDVGMGLSQVLPVLQALFNKYRDTSTSHSILLIEQPELHLHPKMQSALLLEIWRALSGGRHWSQIVLETHSEAMLLRLQREVHDKRIPNTEVSILYVDSALSAVESESVRRLHLDSAGKFIDSWPESFSDLRVRDLGF